MRQMLGMLIFVQIWGRRAPMGTGIGGVSEFIEVMYTIGSL